MKKGLIITVIMGFIVILIALIYFLNSSKVLVATRTEKQAFDVTFNKIVLFQDIISSSRMFSISDFKTIFGSDVHNLELKLRRIYNINNMHELSLVGELMKLKKDEMSFTTTRDKIFMVKNYNYKIGKYHFAWNVALLTFKDKESVYLKVHKIMGTLSVTDSMIGSKTFLDIISLSNNGVVTDKSLEKAFLRRIKYLGAKS